VGALGLKNRKPSPFFLRDVGLEDVGLDLYRFTEDILFLRGLVVEEEESGREGTSSSPAVEGELANDLMTSPFGRVRVLFGEEHANSTESTLSKPRILYIYSYIYIIYIFIFTARR